MVVSYVVGCHVLYGVEPQYDEQVIARSGYGCHLLDDIVESDRVEYVGVSTGFS